ncbi:hypothetical protein [Arthrobacter sp. UM1]|uniref:hypothetical protein n=1 Tax=Arthrobacter sp. UM1 TaxID=2766776 RepID=UPI001CF633A0|nr:hypothetical protein [Arthrobacter sp. UM1]MCB4209162.1 hypothetical protein [Arthrobacter sp. UM1]
MNIKKQWAFAELKDGRIFEGVRVGVQSKLQFEVSARANGWSLETTPIHASIFLAWHATREAGLHALEWSQFVAESIDAGITEKAPETPEIGQFTDPTQPDLYTELQSSSPSDPAFPPTTG